MARKKLGGKPSWFVDRVLPKPSGAFHVHGNFERREIGKPTGEFHVHGNFEQREIKRSGHYGQYWEGGFQDRDVPKPRTGEYFHGAYQAPDNPQDLDPWGNYYFSLEIETVEIAQFLECSGLKTSATVFEIEEGGLIAHTHKRPGYSKWENIVLKRGVDEGTAFAEWRDKYLQTPDGGWSDRSTSTGAIVVRNNAGEELRRYTIVGCWPVSWEGPSLNAGGSELAIETLEIAHEGLYVDDTPRPAKPTGSQDPDPGGGGGGGGDTVTDNVVVRFIAKFGIDITQADNQGLEGMEVEDHVDMMGVARASFNTSGFDWSSVNLGDGVQVGFGGTSDMTFGGYVTGIRHFKLLDGNEFVELIAMDPLCKLGASRHTRIWEEQTDDAIANDVLGQASVEIGTVDSTSTTHKYVIQRNESDLTFLRRLAARNGYLLLGNYEGKVDFMKPQYSAGPIELTTDKLMAFEYTVSPAEVPPDVTVYGWDYVAKEKVEGTASSIDTIGGGASALDAAGIIWQETCYISDVHVNDADAATAMAESELNRMARSYVRGRGVTDGTGEIRAGVKLKFSGFATGFNPEVFVVASKHKIQSGMYVTEFYFEGNTKPE
ncbi:MAG: phage tail protein [Deltaproteobacteria bacterium]|nr:phage tail protein [Deltaproteobacteria bacterium]